MPWTSKGGDLSPVVNPSTGRTDYAFDATGNPIWDDTKSFAVASLVTQHQGQWLPDLTGLRGSKVYTVRNDTRAAPSQLQSYTLDGLQPLLDSGEITGPPGQDGKPLADPVVVVSGGPRQKRVDITYSTPKVGLVIMRVPL